MFILYSFLVWFFRKLTSDVPVAELSGGGTSTIVTGCADDPTGTSVATVGSGVARGVIVGAGGGGGVAPPPQAAKIALRIIVTANKDMLLEGYFNALMVHAP